MAAKGDKKSVDSALANELAEAKAAAEEAMKEMQAAKEEVELLKKQVDETESAEIVELKAQLAKYETEANEAQKQADEKIPIRIPMDELNPEDTDVPVSINGKTTLIKRGHDVEVSRPVFEVLKKAKYI